MARTCPHCGGAQPDDEGEIRMSLDELVELVARTIQGARPGAADLGAGESPAAPGWGGNPAPGSEPDSFPSI